MTTTRQEDPVRDAPARPERLIMVASNSAWNIANFRGRLTKDLLAGGYDVVAVAPADGHEEKIREMGAEFRPIRLNGSGLSVLADLRLFIDYLRLIRQLRPDAFLGFTVKPNIYGSLAAGLLGVRTINNISGLGTAFIRGGLLGRLVAWLYRISLRQSATVFFQNPADLRLFLDKGLVREDQSALIPGSGVDLTRFSPAEPKEESSPFRFLLVARLLWDKGLGEYVAAARRLRAERPDVRFHILGFAGADNRSAVPIEEVERWRGEENVEYLGETDDVRPFIAQADCMVLPSYREGLPRSLLEGSAMAKPMIATDVPGCRDLVADGETGFLCEPRSAEALAVAMAKMLDLPADQRLAMGRRARAKAEAEYDEALVSKAYFDALRA
jgi:glycosyltransferase involved in cell wall biosynthesis